MELKAIDKRVQESNHKNIAESQLSSNSFDIVSFSSKQTVSDLYVFNHHIYEYKKGLRNLVLTTEKASNRKTIEDRLVKEIISYVVHEVSKDKINVYFGHQECIDVVDTFNPHLNLLTPEQDFILGIMLGYDGVKQCKRYMKMRRKF